MNSVAIMTLHRDAFFKVLFYDIQEDYLKRNLTYVQKVCFPTHDFNLIQPHFHLNKTCISEHGDVIFGIHFVFTSKMLE